MCLVAGGPAMPRAPETIRMTPFASPHRIERSLVSPSAERPTLGACSPGAIWGSTRAEAVSCPSLTNVASPRAPHGARVAARFVAGDAALVVAGFGADERSILASRDDRIGVAIDGRIDNVAELRRQIPQPLPDE